MGDYEIVEGEIGVRRHDDGRVEITQAPPVSRVSLELLASADPVTVRVSGHRITFGGQVTYEVTGWDELSHALLVRKTEDRRA